MRDRDVRNAVLQRLTELHYGDDDTRIVQEMGVWSGSVRIDIAVINGELAGYELKSDRDTLTRLPAQADLYSRVFDRVVLVVGRRHAEKAQHQIPEWWGVTVAKECDGAVSLEAAREAQLNPARDPYLIAQLLWKEEALAILESRGLARGWKARRIKAIHERLACELSLRDLCSFVRSALKARHEWLRQDATSQLDVPIDT